MIRRYAFVVEKPPANCAPYGPDPPGCVAKGNTVEDAVEIHVQGLLEDGLPFPEPSSEVDYLQVPA